MTDDPSSPAHWRTFWLTAPVVFMVSLDATVVVAAFPALRQHFSRASPADLSWTLNGYTIVYAALLVACGRLADQHGRKRCFLLGLAVFTLASGGCALAANAWWLAVARALQAAGAALLTPSSLALVLAEFPPDERQKAISLWSALGALAAAVGPGFGSAIIEWAAWPWLFLINVPLGIVTFWRGNRDLSESLRPTTQARFDFLGTMLLIVGVGSITGGIVGAGESGQGSVTTWAGTAVGLGLLGLFVVHGRRQETAARELGLFAEPNFRWASVATLIFGAAFSLMFLSFYLFTMGIWRYRQSMAGLAATAGPLMVIAGVILTGRLSQRLGPRRMLMIGGTLFFLSNLWFVTRLTDQPDYLGVWFPGQLVGGLAIALILPTLIGAALAGLPPAQLAVGNAMNTALRQLGGALGVALGVALVGSAQATLEQFRAVYASLAAAGIILALLSQGLTPARGVRP